MQFGVAVRNARTQAIETTAGVSAKIFIYDDTGGVPADCATAVPGSSVLLCQYNLASDWMGAPSAGLSTLNNLPIAGTALANGNPAFFRITDSTGATCHVQGTVGGPLSNSDMLITSVPVSLGDDMSITAASWNDGDA